MHLQDIVIIHPGPIWETTPTISRKLSCRFALIVIIIVRSVSGRRMVPFGLILRTIRCARICIQVCGPHLYLMLNWTYLACTELGAYQVAPASYPSLVMKVLRADYTWVFFEWIASVPYYFHRQQWCNWAFPPGRYNRIPPTPDLSAINKYGGYNISVDRLAFIDGGKSEFWTHQRPNWVWN